MKLRAALIAGLLVASDQLAKFWALTRLELNNSRPLLKNALHLTLVYNNGAAFGFFKKKAAVFIFISAAAVIIMLFYAGRFGRDCRFARTGLLLIFAGAMGNLIDRIRLGYVVDFIDLRVWPVFNFADIFISIGGLLLICHVFMSKNKFRITC